MENINDNNQSYPEEMLMACENGQPCEYGICDECPLLNRSKRNEEE